MDKCNILGADDEPERRRMLEEVIRANDNYRLLGIVNDGEHVLSQTALSKPDLILTDYLMEPIDGLTALLTLRRIGITTPDIILTGTMEMLQENLNTLEIGFEKKETDFEIGPNVRSYIELPKRGIYAIGKPYKMTGLFEFIDKIRHKHR